ncbi:hypothetical protein [Paenibacillus anseongense]
MFNDLKYNDYKVEIRYDTTKDKFGASVVRTYTCEKLNYPATQT